MIRIAFFSFADIDNFGDILFSHIFKMEMEKHVENIEIDFFSPTDFTVEGLTYSAYNRKKIEGKYDALITFGGEIIHLYDQRTWIPIYKKNMGRLESELPSDTIFDWVNIKKPFKAWISVGVRPIATEQDFKKIRESIDQLDYISTRGILSKKILEGLDLEYNDTRIEITPDLGWLFPTLLDYKKCRGAHYKKFTDPDKNYLIFQINNITSDEAREIAQYLLKFKEETGLEVILLPVIRPWEDSKYLSMINYFSGSKLRLLPNDLSILEIADILVHSQLVVSSSLHAAITALSEGIPAGIINKWQGTKLQDIFGHQFRLHMVKHNLDEIPVLLKQLLDEKAKGNEYLRTYALFNKQRLKILFENLLLNLKRKNMKES